MGFINELLTDCVLFKIQLNVGQCSVTMNVLRGCYNTGARA